MSEDDLPRDAHLRASLRHAPDAAIGPPASLSEAILAEARAKARTPGAAAATRRHPLLALWNALTQPAVGTAVAGLTMATVVGLMWWQGPGDEALPARAPVAPVATTAPVESRAEAPATVPPQVQKEEPKKKVENQGRAEKEVQRRAPAPAPTPEPAPVSPPAAVAAAPRPAPMPAPVEEKAMADSATEARARSQVRARENEAHAAATGAAAAKSESARSEQHLRQSFADAAVPDLAGLLAAMSAESARWTWRFAGDNEARPVDAALEEWMARADTATRGTWHKVEPSGQEPARALHLMLDGRVRHLLQLDADRITWIDSAGRAWQALLPPSLQEGPTR